MFKEQINLPKPKGQEKVEKKISKKLKKEIKSSKFLFIDDDKGLLDSLQNRFSDKNVAFAECHSVEDALQAIAKYQPEAIFLDHHLTEDHKGEGLEIADRLKGKGVKIYSTTSDSSAKEEYRKRRIECVSKIGAWDLEPIIAGKKKNKETIDKD